MKKHICLLIISFISLNSCSDDIVNPNIPENALIRPILFLSGTSNFNTLNTDEISIQNIQIVNGSQQALDLIGKIYINPHDHIVMEEPGYLGAIDSFSLYQPIFHGITMEEDGPDCCMLDDMTDLYPVSLMYGILSSCEKII